MWKYQECARVLQCYSIAENQLLDEYLHQQKIYNPNNDLLETNQEAVQKLLLNHPFPRHQGPFEKDITYLQYGYISAEEDSDQYTFYSYTTFLHEYNQPCKVWSINSQKNDGEPKHVLTFTTEEIMNDLNLWGPASDLNMSIMYNCNKHKCVIICPCTVCEVSNSPSSQCLKHHVDLQRKFNKKVHSFTIPCSSNQFVPLYKDHIQYGDEFHSGHRYAGIPRSCLQCRLDLLDHQIHHHVLHQRCKFCAVILRIWEADEPLEFHNVKSQIQRTDNSTCSFCYKIFTSHANQVIHERTEHDYVKMDDLRRPGALHYNSEMYNQSYKLLKCSICKCSCDDNMRLREHKMNEHGIVSEKTKKT